MPNFGLMIKKLLTARNSNSNLIGSLLGYPICIINQKMVGPPGFDPGTLPEVFSLSRLSAERSNQAEPRALLLRDFLCFKGFLSLLLLLENIIGGPEGI